ncbi:M48 family metalloprotease [Rubripirellula sp.]|nr:M48 family metalloprotease [Rubripirellula sp.]MDF1845345.1 M48 family metalloprotease [Rubripirellula sp.]
MHLYLFLLVIVSLSCGSLPSQDGTILEPALATACMTLAWILLCHVSARICAVQVLREHIDPLAAAKLMERQLDIFRWLGLGVVVLCLAGFGLARNLDNISILSGSSFLQAVILLMPGLAITLGTWSAEHWYGVKVGYTNSKFQNFYRSLWQIFRGNVAWLIVPVLILLGLSDLISLMPVDEATSGMITVIMILLFVPLGLPWLVRHLFKTERLDSGTERWVCELMTAVGLRRTRAVRWNTASQSFNALVAGFVPPLRTLLVSDRLLDELPQEQVAMVVLHEAAHLRRKHVPLRMLSVLPAWGAGALLTQLAGDQSWAMAAGSGVGIIMTLVILRLVAYRTEYDADVQACRMAERIAAQLPGVPPTYDQAADALSAALMRVTFDQPESRRATWLHPGVADRVNFMRRERTTASENNATAGTMANPA